MRILYTLFSYLIAVRLFAKNDSKKTYLLIGTIVTAIVTLTDITIIISLGFSQYFIAYGWQVLVAFALFIIYIFVTKTKVGMRRISFERKKKRKPKETISTARSRGLLSIVTGTIVLLISIILLVIKLLDIYDDIPIIAYIASFAGFVVMLVFGIVMILKSSEKMILIVWTDKLEVYSKKIDSKMSFNYMNVISDIYRYYIIEKLATVYYKGDTKEIHYVWILKTENLNNYDITKLPMEKDKEYWYNEVVEDMYKLKGSKFIFEIEKDNIVKVIRR